MTTRRPASWRKFSTYSADRQSTVFTGRGPEVDFDLPAELLPRIVELDLKDQTAILSFIESFGFLQAPVDSGVWNYDDPAYFWNFDPKNMATRMTWQEEGERTFWSVSEEELIDDFRMGAALLKTSYVLAGEIFGASRFSVARVRKAWPPYAPLEAPIRKAVAAAQLTRILEMGLLLQDLRVVVHPDGSDLEIGPRPRFSLFGLMALELIDSIQNGLKYRHCARAKCGRLFLRQQGYRSGEKNVFSRSDSKYCTTTCARAEAQRATYRRRRERLKKEASSGTYP